MTPQIRACTALPQGPPLVPSTHVAQLTMPGTPTLEFDSQVNLHSWAHTTDRYTQIKSVIKGKKGEFYSVIRKERISSADWWMELETIVLSKKKNHRDRKVVIARVVTYSERQNATHFLPYGNNFICDRKAEGEIEGKKEASRRDEGGRVT